MSGELLIRFAPYFADWTIALCITLTVALLLYSFWRGARGLVFRAAALALLVLMLLNPSIIYEMREEKPDIMVVVSDQSASNQINDRQSQAQKILAELQDGAAKLDGVEPHLVFAGESGEDLGGTHLFTALARATAEIPKSRIGAVVMITDGQVHDVPVGAYSEDNNHPFHVLLTGHSQEKDRRLKIIRSPGFGLVGQEQAVTLHVEDNMGIGQTVTAAIRRDGEFLYNRTLPIGQDITIELPIEHAGANIFEISLDKEMQELSDENNHAVITINGVRDRLRVLLISGDPHPGTRVWRNFLKSDPMVDLVHFTILRPPEKQDAVPTEELSLIAFPVRELFEEKLNDFSLIIFDRYRRLSILPTEYMQNIVRYVEQGGAILAAEGPLEDMSLSLFDTAVGTILPGMPSGKQLEGRFTPKLSDHGNRHPLTSDLPGVIRSAGDAPPIIKWGSWHRQVDAKLRTGTVLLEGIDGKPLLVLDRVGKGRVAQLFSDHIWLWARGHEGGGPHSELLRRLAHWLMKEPQLEENDLKAEAQGRSIVVSERSLDPYFRPVLLHKPGGESEAVALRETSPGLASAKIHVGKAGLYRISNGERSVMVGVGGLNPLEFADLRSSKAKMQSFVEQQNGSIRWELEDGMPDLRRAEASRYMSGKNWIGIKRNHNYVVTGVSQHPVIPGFAYLLGAIILWLLAWHREGR